MSKKFPVELLRPSLISIIKELRPELLEKKYITRNELDYFRTLYFDKVLSNIEQNDELRKEIVQSLTTNDFVVDNINNKFKDSLPVAEKVSVSLASFFGSWIFIISIVIFISTWTLYNIYSANKIDPLPFSILGIILAALSAIQAPLILNSQKNQSLRDRMKLDEDFQTNLKSELEIRNLHSKIDHYNKIIWEKLDKINK